MYISSSKIQWESQTHKNILPVTMSTWYGLTLPISAPITIFYPRWAELLAITQYQAFVLLDLKSSLCVCLSVNLSVCLSDYLSICQSVCLTICLSKSVCLSDWLSVYPSICLSDYLSIRQAVCLTIYLSICLFYIQILVSDCNQSWPSYTFPLRFGELAVNWRSDTVLGAPCYHHTVCRAGLCLWTRQWKINYFEITWNKSHFRQFNCNI